VLQKSLPRIADVRTKIKTIFSIINRATIDVACTKKCQLQKNI